MVFDDFATFFISLQRTIFGAAAENLFRWIGPLPRLVRFSAIGSAAQNIVCVAHICRMGGLWYSPAASNPGYRLLAYG
jgi:hypothetical protein